jgi:hypothetical protein
MKAEKGSLTQVEAALLLEVCDRTFRRYMNQYERVDWITDLLSFFSRNDMI